MRQNEQSVISINSNSVVREYVFGRNNVNSIGVVTLKHELQSLELVLRMSFQRLSYRSHTTVSGMWWKK